MFTVLIAEKEHIDAIQQENRLFFEPFLENKELAFCPWNPEGQSLEDSVPGLLDAVGRHKEWRAVIVNCCKGDMLKARNPFDIVDYSALSSFEAPEQRPVTDDSRKVWEAEWNAYNERLTEEKEKIYQDALTYPLQKLSTWLCYIPENYILNDVQERQDVQEWAMEQIGTGMLKPSVWLEHTERDQYKRELRLKEHVRRTFAGEHRLNVAHPKEVHCISLRTAESNFFDPDSFWNMRSDNEYSEFADRNMYFDKMRFMVFDLLPRTHRDFRTDYIRFMASLLIFISNPVPGSAMQARRLYQLETETDDAPLCTLVTSYDRKLAATSEVISNEMEKIRNEIPGNLSDKEVEALLSTPKNVAVVLDESCDLQRIYAENDYGLFFDYPENGTDKWNKSYNASKSAFAYIMKQRSRSVKKSVGQAKLHGKVLDVDVSRLTPLQIDDIRDYTDSIENDMISAIPKNLTDSSELSERLEKDSKEIKKVMRRRMKRSTAMALMGVFLGLFLLCFLPFVFSNYNTTRTASTAILLTGTMLAIFGVMMVVVLFILRLSIKNAVRAYNNSVKDGINDVSASLQDFSEYLSDFCNVKRGHAIQNYAKRNLDDYTKGLRIRQKHQEDIRKKRAYLAEGYRDYFGDKSSCDETMSRPYEYDFDQRTEYTYPAPFLAGDNRLIEFISNGNMVTVPSSYVKKISVKLEGIYDK